MTWATVLTTWRRISLIWWRRLASMTSSRVAVETVAAWHYVPWLCTPCQAKVAVCMTLNVMLPSNGPEYARVWRNLTWSDRKQCLPAAISRCHSWQVVWYSVFCNCTAQLVFVFVIFYSVCLVSVVVARGSSHVSRWTNMSDQSQQ